MARFMPLVLQRGTMEAAMTVRQLVFVTAIPALVTMFYTGVRAEPARETENPSPPVSTTNMETATFAAGCFWGVEEAFRTLDGVGDTCVGYTGGHTDNPSYREVCTDQTGHAEAVQVRYDPATISYAQLLDVFWKCHNPTTRNRQGPDIGSQYRSAIFYHSDAQRAAAEASRDRLQESGRLVRPVVTEIVPAATFHRAEEYHQKYLLKRGGGSCH
jgi:peptide-methionine (S)-S-oxide reductase